jgi:hypothetical protein
MKELINKLLLGGRAGLAFSAAQMVLLGVVVIAAAGVYSYFYYDGGTTTQQKTYTDPKTSGGKWVDHCYRFAADCDAPAATAWCKAQPEKWTRSIESAWAYARSPTDVTHVMGDNRDCTGTSCGRFVKIVCAK